MAGGMITSTIHVLILVPVFFVLMKERALRGVRCGRSQRSEGSWHAKGSNYRVLPFRVLPEAVRIFLRGFPLSFCWPPTSIILGNVTVCAGIWWRFGGGSDRNRALLCNEGNSMHGMQMAQGRINTGYFASC
jgi:hypothetical protein